MICTEKEASEKWCPQARQAASGIAVVMNRSTSGMLGPKCVGSACMMWEWSNGGNFGPLATSDSGLDTWLKNGWSETEESMVDHRRVVLLPENRRGTCGLINRGGA